MQKLFLGIYLFLTANYALAVTVTDPNGYEVVIPDKVERVATLTIPLASMIMSVDLSTQRLVGMHKASRVDIEHGLLGRLFPDAEKVPSKISGEGFVPNVEEIASQRPDVVFQWGDRGESIVKPIRQLGLPVITLKYGDSEYAADWLKMVGYALHKPERAEQLAGWFKNSVKEIKDRAALSKDKPRAIYLFRTRSGFKVAGQNTSMALDIEKVGGINVAASVKGFAPVDIEQLLLWDPEVIILNNFEPGLKPQELTNDTRLASISAIKNERVYVYPHGGFRWDPPSQETPLSLDWLSRLMHPNENKGNFRLRVKEAYRLLYNYEMSAEDFEHLLKMDTNGKSLNYQKLFGANAQ